MVQRSYYKIGLFIFWISLNCLYASAQSVNQLDTAVTNAANVFLKDTSRMALSVGVYNHGKYHIYHFGKVDKGGGKPVDQSVYEIGSITKTMTGSLLAHAVVEKKLKLEDDVRKYIDGDYPNLEYSGQPIRLSQLLNHSSGLPFSVATDSTDGRVYSKEAFFKALHLVKLDTVPGIKLSYSNSAAILLAYVLEKVYKQSYEQLLNKYLLRPLGMKETALEISERMQKNVLKGFDGHGKTMVPTGSGAAGGVHSTVPDMLRYINYEVNENDSVVALTHKPTWGQIQYYAMGLNWQMMHKAGTERTVFQSGGTAGFSSCLIMYPDLKTGIILLTNESDRSAQDKLSEMAYRVLGVVNKI
jgi:CubicO group peptidase (beta-lactamase class C family)